MDFQGWSDDETLLDDLRHALAASDTVDERVLAAARGAFAWRTVDAELAELVRDSAVDGPVGVRSDGRGDAPRILSFATEGIGVEIEVGPRGIVGQLLPCASGEVDLLTLDEGLVASATADEVGCFNLPAPHSRTVRLRCRAGELSFVTDWVIL